MEAKTYLSVLKAVNHGKLLLRNFWKKFKSHCSCVKLDTHLDPYPHWEKQLNPDPQKINADPQTCSFPTNYFSREGTAEFFWPSGSIRSLTSRGWRQECCSRSGGCWAGIRHWCPHRPPPSSPWSSWQTCGPHGESERQYKRMMSQQGQMHCL